MNNNFELVDIHNNVAKELYNLILLLNTIKSFDNKELENKLKLTELILLISNIKQDIDEYIYKKSKDCIQNNLLLNYMIELLKYVNRTTTISQFIIEKLEYHKTKYFYYYRTLILDVHINLIIQSIKDIINQHECIIKM